MKKKSLVFMMSLSLITGLTACTSISDRILEAEESYDIAVQSADLNQVEAKEHEKNYEKENQNKDNKNDDSGESESEHNTAAIEKEQEMQEESVMTSPFYKDRENTVLKAGVSILSPAIVEADHKYYIYGTHLASAESEDTMTWVEKGNGYQTKNPLYAGLAADAQSVFAYAGSQNSAIPTDDGGEHIWTPQVIYNRAMDCYVMYFATSSNWKTSCISYATAKTVDGPFQYQGTVLYSGFTEDTLEQTDLLDYMEMSEVTSRYFNSQNEYNVSKYPNCVSPCPFYDKEGKMWLAYGSGLGGIFLVELDETTGKVVHNMQNSTEREFVDSYYGRRLCGGYQQNVQSPCLIYHPDANYYYLFVSYGNMNRDGGYQIRVFRSTSTNGNYIDMFGKKITDDVNLQRYGLKLSGNYSLPGLTYGYKATGGCSVVRNEFDQSLICYQTRFEGTSEYHEPRVKQFFVNKQGWPCFLPYSYRNEKISENGYSLEELAGEYYLLNQGTEISAEIAKPQTIRFDRNGKIYGDRISGSWRYEEGSYYMSFTYRTDILAWHSYSGVFCKQKDPTGKNVMTFSAVGDNMSVWGVKYLED